MIRLLILVLLFSGCDKSAGMLKETFELTRESSYAAGFTRGYFLGLVNERYGKPHPETFEEFQKLYESEYRELDEDAEND